MTKKKSCKKGYYYCNIDEKCKKIPKGYHLMSTGYLMKDSDHKEDEKSDDTEGKKTNGNGNGSNGNGNGNGGSNGGSNGGGVSEAWSAKYKKSIDCDNPKGFSQKAHCRGRKIDEGKDGMSDHEVSMAKGQVRNSITNLKRVEKVLKTMTDKDDLPAWLQAKITDTEHNTDAAAGYMDEEVITEKRDGKSSKDKGYSLRDWFKGGGWKQTGGKYDGKPCAKQPGQKTKPYCRDADDRAAMSKKERNKRAAKKRREDPNPNKKGKAKNVKQESYSNWRTELDEGILGGLGLAAAAYGAYKVGQHLKKKGDEALDNARQNATLRGKPFGAGARQRAIEDAAGVRRGTLDPNMQRLRNSYEPEGEVVEGRYSGGGGLKGTDNIRYGAPKGSPPGTKGPLKNLNDIDRKLSSDTKGLQANSYELEGELVDEGKKDACYHKVKSRYSVWPSAYASGALVKCRKVGAKNWGNKSKKKNESYDLSNWRDDFQATEYESVDIIKAEPLEPTQGLGSEMLEEKSKKDRLKEISGQLKKASAMHAKQSKAVAKCADELDEGTQLDEKCWKGYEKKGMKTMFGKRYPNCVKKEETEVVEGKYSSGSVTYVKGTAPVRASYGGKPESFAKETYKKKVRLADEVQLGEKKDPCWDTHEMKGMKKKGNRMVPNCVRKEQVSDWRSELDLQEKEFKSHKMYDPKTGKGYDAETEEDHLRMKKMGYTHEKPKKKNCGCGKDPCETYGKKEVKEDWQKSNRKDGVDGMSQSSVNAYKRENPGSKLKTAVTGKVKKGSKDAKRRKSFCSRSNGQRKMHNIDCSKTPDKKICKARRRWKC